MSNSNKFIYKEGDDVFGYHGILMYHAKVIESEMKDRIPHYFIHYQKWSKKWDEWVTADRLEPFTDENKEKEQLLLQKVREAKKRKGKRKIINDDEDRPKKSAKKDDNSIATFTLNIPSNLKRQLVVDWENITRDHKLVKLPHHTTISELLSEFVESKPESRRNDIEEIIEGLENYFDKCLGNLLLYRFERPQYSDLSDKKLIDIYGIEHLLRLFVKLPELISKTQLTTQQANTLKTKLSELLKYLNSKKEDIFAEYIETDTKYQNLVEEQKEE